MAEPATKDDVAAVERKVAVVEHKVTSIELKVTAVEQKVSAVEQKVSAVEQKVSAVEQKVSAVEQNVEILRSEMHHQYNDLVERIEDGKTELLKAFYSFASGEQKRMTQIEGNEGALRSRIATIEDRLLEVEKRLNIPPAA
jgi:chromosome segregation ATPase